MKKQEGWLERFIIERLRALKGKGPRNGDGDPVAPVGGPSFGPPSDPMTELIDFATEDYDPEW